jgi:hypothetical protein
MYNPYKHGRAEYGSWIEVTPALSADEYTAILPLSAQRFAQVVFVSNSDSIAASLSGVVLNTDHPYSTIIKISGDYTFVMKAETGTGITSGDTGWQMQRIFDDGVTSEIMWADGNSNFDNIASGYLTATYQL